MKMHWCAWQDEEEWNHSDEDDDEDDDDSSSSEDDKKMDISLDVAISATMDSGDTLKNGGREFTPKHSAKKRQHAKVDWTTYVSVLWCEKIDCPLTRFNRMESMFDEQFALAKGTIRFKENHFTQVKKSWMSGLVTVKVCSAS